MNLFKAICSIPMPMLKRIESLEARARQAEHRSEAYSRAMVRLQENIEDLNSRVSALEAKGE